MDKTDDGMTMQDVARSLGVSVSTVSLALSGNKVVAAATRERVRLEAERLGYVYNRRAASLRKSSRNLVGLVVPDITNPFAAEAALGLQNAEVLDGHMVALSNTREQIQLQTEILTTLIEERATGIVLIPAIGTQASDLQILIRSGMPTVLMNRDIPESGLSFLGADDDAIIRCAVGHLVATHHVGSAAYFGGLAAASPRQSRSRLFGEYLAGMGVANDKTWDIPTLPNAEAAYESALTRLQTGPLPDAVLCHSDSIALGFLRALAVVGGEQRKCAVVGIDGIAGGRITTPSLTTVGVYPGRMGAEAGRLLLSQAKPISQPTDREDLEPALVLRESCGCEPDLMSQGRVPR